MASTPKQVNGNGQNSSSGNRKKGRGSKTSYLSKWLDKTMHHIQETAPAVEQYDVMPMVNWPPGRSQFAPGYDPYRHMYGAAEPMSLPTLPSYYSPMVAHGVPMYPEHRYVPCVKTIQVHRPRMSRRSEQCAEEIPNSIDESLQAPKNLSEQDYASLPPIITSIGDTYSEDMNEKEKDESGSNARRYSDPCLTQGLPDVARPANADVDSESDSSSNSSGSQVGSRLLSYLLDQIATLKIANDRLNKDLLDTRAELESTRQHNAILHKGPASSMGATPNHSLDNGLSGGYSPGLVTDLVREIRDAARIREEAMYTRVKAMLLERNDNLASTEAKLTEKTLEEVKSSLRASETDKRRMMDRINKLEDEVHALRLSGPNGPQLNDSKLTNGIMEEPEVELMRVRKELAETRRAKQAADETVHKLERLVTQMLSKCNGHTNGPDSLPSEPEHKPSARTRRSSLNSSNNSTVVCGPVTDL